MIGALRRGYCKVVTNDGGGKYTVTEQIYKASTGAMEAATANGRVVLCDAYEVSGLATLSSGGGPYAFVEVIGKEGAPIILFGTNVGSGETAEKLYTFRCHTGGFELTDTGKFYTVDDVLNCRLEVFIEIRDCNEDGAVGEHPKFRTAIYTAGDCVTYIQTGPEGDDAWHTISALHISTTGTVNYATGYDFQFRITGDGNLELRFDGSANPGIGNAVMYGFVRVIPFGEALADGTLEIGTSQTATSGGVLYNDHEVGTPADPSFTPPDDPATYEWGDNLWRQ